MKIGERKIEISLEPDTDPENQDTPYFYIILEWSDKPATQAGVIVPGTENGCWFNTGICGWAASPADAFVQLMIRKALMEESRKA